MSVGEMSNIVGGGTPARSEPAYWREGSTPWITPTDLTANGSKYIASGAESISTLGLEHSNATLAPTKSIVFSTRGTVGNIALAANPLTCNQSCEILVPRTDVVDPEFFFYLLQFGHSAFIRLSGGTTFGAITRRDIARVRFSVPSRMVEQASIARILDTVDSALGRTREAVQKARDLRLALIQKVFSEGLRGEKQKKSTIGYIPSSWSVVPVRSVVDNFQYGLSVPMDDRGTLPILRMGNIQEGDVLFSDVKYVNLPDDETKPYLLHRGDVLFNRTNSQEWVGKIGIYRQDQPSVFASYLIRLLPAKGKVDPYYLGHILGTYSVQCRIRRYATPGVQQVNVNARNLARVLIPLPIGEAGILEQRHIAALVEAAEARIRNFRHILAAQEALKRSLMQDLLTSKVRVDVTSDDILKMAVS